MHDVNPIKYHRRLGVVTCDICPSELQQEIMRKIEELDDVDKYEPWQRKLATEVLAAQMAEAPVSNALQAYLDDRSLVADPGEIDDEPELQ